jgi:hypothetical protein
LKDDNKTMEFIGIEVDSNMRTKQCDAEVSDV